MADKEKIPFDASQGVFLEIVYDLPASIYRGVGRVITAHALLEAQVLELLCIVSRTDYNVGRVAYRYQAAGERFKLIRRLLLMHGIKPKVSLKRLFEDIEESCRVRDSFAHGLWVRTREGLIALRLTKGEYETPDGLGRVDRSFVPQVTTVSQENFHHSQREILAIAHRVSELKKEVSAALESREPSSPQTPVPEAPPGHNPLRPKDRRQS